MVFDLDRILESPETKYNTLVLKILIDFYLTSMRPGVLGTEQVRDLAVSNRAVALRHSRSGTGTQLEFLSASCIVLFNSAGRL